MKVIKVNTQPGLACEHGGPETRPRGGGTGGRSWSCRTWRRYLWSSYELPLWHFSNLHSILLQQANGGAGLKPGMRTISQQEAEHISPPPHAQMSPHTQSDLEATAETNDPKHNDKKTPKIITKGCFHFRVY